ncbi:MAG TPA: rod shape-determining protein MreD [Actinomycetota bacterium]|jgi:rod shape-determining protein MreD|nr:rod shape-determining protein MreD [Actinomycetota bacterium]
MRRVLALIAVIVTAILLQSTVFSQLRLLGVRPELLYLVTILIALQEGPNEGAVVGFTCGLAQDMLLDQPMGITALTLTLLGYAVGMARQYIVSPSPLVPTIVVAISTALGVAFYEIVTFLLGQFEAGFTYAVKVALLTALYNAVLTPILAPLLRRIVEGSRPRRVVRL